MSTRRIIVNTNKAPSAIGPYNQVTSSKVENHVNAKKKNARVHARWCAEIYSYYMQFLLKLRQRNSLHGLFFLVSCAQIKKNIYIGLFC